MSFWVLLQVLVNLILVAGVGVLWVRLGRPAKDDPRLSKGLQLLQSKIAVLEDLSDRTETQVAQLTALLEVKCREIQEKISAADRQIDRIDQSAQKSLEVAQIFQDRIPHSEILERQNTIKYVTAARLAHRGVSIDEIAARVDLSRAELEFIAKVNREQLQFSEEDLPEWARQDAADHTHAIKGQNVQFSLPRENFATSFKANAPSEASAQMIASMDTHSAAPPRIQEQAFMEIDLRATESSRTVARPAAQAQSATRTASAQTNRNGSSPNRPTDLRPPAARPGHETIQAQTSSGKTVEVTKVLFPRIDKQ